MITESTPCKSYKVGRGILDLYFPNGDVYRLRRSVYGSTIIDILGTGDVDPVKWGLIKMVVPEYANQFRKLSIRVDTKAKGP